MITGFAEYAAYQFWLDTHQSDGATLREHAMSVWERTGKQPAMLADAPVLPKACGQLWADFLSMHHRRAVGQFGPARLTYVEIDAWQRVKGVKLAAWEIGALEKADAAFMAEYASRVKPGGGSNVA